jgi:gluconokinase
VTRVVALDVGTSSARALVYGEDGECVPGVGRQEGYTETRGHSGRLGEFDADELVSIALAAVEEARREAGGGVDAVGISCFWHSLVAIDERGRALTPVLTWRDTRSDGEARELARTLDAEAVHRRTGCPLHASFWPPKLLWLRREQPEAFRAASRFVSFSDLLLLRAAGTARTSLSMASATGLLGLDGRWDEELLAAVGVEPERLPEVSDAEADGWLPAIGDGACSNVGTGCTGRERAAVMIGTSGALRVVYAAAEPRPRTGLFLYRLDADRVVEGGSLSDGGNLVDWLERTLRIAKEDAVGLADSPPGAHGLDFVTLLGGERSPAWDASARGSLSGLTFATEPRQVLHAALEGVALRFADIGELLPELREAVASGAGLLHSRDWAQIVADALGLPVTLSAVDEGSARGAAVLALERLGVAPPPAPLGERLEPRPARTAFYRKARARQRALLRAFASGQDGYA